MRFIFIGSAALTALMRLWVLSDVLICWLVAINVVALGAYGYDKAIAGRRRQRISENTLLLAAVIGGTIGAWLGMRLFRHKTAKPLFQWKFRVAVVIQAVLVAVYFLWP